MAGDGSVELPDEDGAFQVNAMDSSLVWMCDGDSSKPLDQDAGESEPPWEQPGPSGYRYTYQPTDLTRKRERSEREGRKYEHSSDPAWIKKVEICTLEGLQLKKWFNLSILLTKSLATVEIVADYVSEEAFNGDAVVLLDAEYCRIPDRLDTRGKFILWGRLTGMLYEGD